MRCAVSKHVCDSLEIIAKKNNTETTYYWRMAISQTAMRSSCLVSVYLVSAADSFSSSGFLSDPLRSTTGATLHSRRKWSRIRTSSSPQFNP